MKKGQYVVGFVRKLEFPNKGIVDVYQILDIESLEEVNPLEQIAITEQSVVLGKAVVKNVLPGQKIAFRINKYRNGRGEGGLFVVLEPSPLEIESQCPHYGICGGCNYQSLPYETQLIIKEEMVKSLLEPVLASQGQTLEEVFEPIKGSPTQAEYRNKMEFSFGDEIKDGPLSLGMHKRGSFYDVVTVDHCQLIDEDYRLILTTVKTFFEQLEEKQQQKVSFYHRLRHIGYLRHLLVRKAQKTGEILIALVTTTQEEVDLTPLVDSLLALQSEGSKKLKGSIAGILHTKNDSVADVVQSDETLILYGKDYFYEELLGLTFKISQFSFFQTNTLGAEVLYTAARDFLGEMQLVDGKKPIVYDLYSGTGTIAQMLSAVCKKVIGVEIIEEAVAAAKKNAVHNNITNCEFIAGDVLKVIDTITEQPDVIVLDPPRDGIHPKALQKIIDYGVDKLLYISCKPTSLARDLQVLMEQGYKVSRVTAVDMFPGTVHVEAVILMTKCGSDAKK